MAQGRSTFCESLHTQKHAPLGRGTWHREGQPWRIAICARTRTSWKENMAQGRSALEDRYVRENTHLLEGEHGTGKVNSLRIAPYAETRTSWKKNIARGM